MASTIDNTKPATNSLVNSAEIRALASAAKNDIEALQARETCFIASWGDELAPLTTGTDRYLFYMPFDFSLVKVKASVTTPSSSGKPTFDVRKNGVSIFTTQVSIDANENFSDTASVAGVMTATPLTVSKGSTLAIDVSIAGTGASGAKVYLIGYPVGTA